MKEVAGAFERPDGPATAIEARRLVKSYGPAAPALAGVSLAVAAGRFVAVMGPSGSGKSTLLHLLGALDRPSEGEVLVDGRSLAGLDDDELARLRRRRIGFVFQSFNLIPVLSVRDNVALPAVIDGRSSSAVDERVSHLLASMGLAAFADRLPSQLSGGQQQRAAIARALLVDPAVVLADEPTGNLDSRSGAEILALLRECNRAGTTVMMVTHDPRAAAWSDEVIMLADGLVADSFTLDPGGGGEGPGRPGPSPLDLDSRAHQVLTRLDRLATASSPDVRLPATA